MVKLAFVDTETTGLDPDRHEVWEVGLIVRNVTDLGGDLAAYSETRHLWQLPVDLSVAEPKALEIGRFHERRATDSKSFNDGWVVDTLNDEPGSNVLQPEVWAEQFVELTLGAHLVGAVVSFDAERLSKLLRRWGQCPMWHYHLVDVEALMAGWIAAGNEFRRSQQVEPDLTAAPPWKSSDLSNAVGVDPELFDRHTALGDADWARAIYDAVMAP